MDTGESGSGEVFGANRPLVDADRTAEAGSNRRRSASGDGRHCQAAGAGVAEVELRIWIGCAAAAPGPLPVGGTGAVSPLGSGGLRVTDRMRRCVEFTVVA